ncbi:MULTISPECIES: NAD(P)-dependent oxidoreductase [Ramlibacter]|uniref:NAD-binding protein n=1 Tax=Ramlibacter pinisoli TaxID=2682844 RepID=A0A6N8IT54_9BURK|nr:MULTISPECIES: NAD(P)-dependent oxidoreductase [Ramlibacter]MBA2964937.1 NAD(P)-dependent oxidoreductase [Ramlibacter sp. CGMCC 1.13660]MVQ29902.1 NAD-binding protein [Ramlibacter pinisoli]
MRFQTGPSIGFIGLGVMGGPMCRNMALKHGEDVIAYDASPAAFDAALHGTKALRAGSVAEIAARADIVFLSLPGAPQVERVCLGAEGLTSGERKPWIVVDLSTTAVAAARDVAERLRARNVAFADAPVARTREAAQRGDLSIMVGAEQALFDKIEPLLRYIGSDVTRCGEVGCGQVVKLINNALVFENTMALAEMMVLGQRAGVAPAMLLDAVAKGSGDSFVLRNHGRKAMLPREFPDKSFPPEYVLKDLGYVLELAAQTGVAAHVADLARRYYEATAGNGFSGRYFPAVIEMVDRSIGPAPAPAPAPAGEG